MGPAGVGRALSRGRTCVCIVVRVAREEIAAYFAYEAPVDVGAGGVARGSRAPREVHALLHARRVARDAVVRLGIVPAL